MNFIQWYTTVFICVGLFLVFIEADEALSKDRDILRAFAPGTIAATLLLPIIGRIFNWW
jgi:hypothetical protein